ncbi:Rhomboid family protein [Marinomonas spartinae]|uniref:rhomboid family intramembrane serine protease n=1 Tax=Marinomonas spartinae TaxID=1792290 RepID=UPI000808F449|nr:rhomboid family intramembrane serine protease [Marinomonas spartinae]SBS38489.1 Rhomboid family protein [Marinomonas spartinae]
MNKFPVSAITLGIITAVFSLVVAYLATGSFLGKVTMIQLKSYGGLNVSNLANWEIWRLFTSQLGHSKQYHMFYNVLSLIVLGYVIERRVGWIMFLSVWFLAGASGTLYSTLFVQAPWDTGTGGSQAVLGVAGLGIILSTIKRNNRNLILALMFALIPAFSLDLIFANYPKPGHVLSLVVGMLIGVFYVNRLTRLST